MPDFTLEVCIDSPESALEAEAGGATRLELCANLIIGGTTADLSLFRWVRSHTALPIHALLRPRFGDFLYSDAEYEILCRQAEAFVQNGADALVTGFLTPDGALDEGRLRQLRQIAAHSRLTLHRAFDLCADPFAALEIAKKLGIDSILTSGQQHSCLAGKGLLRELVVRAEGAVEILVGAGVNAEVIAELVPYTGARAFHLSGKRTVDSGMVFRRPGVPMELDSMSEYDILRTDRTVVHEARTVLDRIFQ